LLIAANKYNNEGMWVLQTNGYVSLQHPHCIYYDYHDEIP